MNGGIAWMDGLIMAGILAVIVVWSIAKCSAVEEEME
jgi:hypothetical protein